MFFWSGIVLGLTGSLHCVGMCGPIALALPVNGETPLRKITLIFLYNAGRAITYSILGIVAGLIGLGIVLSGYQQLLSIVAGLILIASAFFPLSSRLRLLPSLFSKLRSLMSGIFHRKDKKNLLLLGLLNGLLPCGMVYMALAMALASGNMAQSAIFMLLFGFGTFPLMIALPYAGTFTTEKMRAKFRRIVPATVCVLGVLLILRGLDLGIPYVSPQFNDPNAPACHQADHHTLKTITCTGHDSQVTK